MPSFQGSLQTVRQFAQEAAAEAREAAGRTFEAIARPKRLETAAEGATRAGQIIALLFLGPVILVCFTLIEVINQIMAEVLGAGTVGSGQVSIVAFLVTFLTLALFCICAWGWFQFVRTAGFGAFTHD